MTSSVLVGLKSGSSYIRVSYNKGATEKKRGKCQPQVRSIRNAKQIQNGNRFPFPISLFHFFFFLFRLFVFFFNHQPKQNWEAQEKKVPLTNLKCDGLCKTGIKPPTMTKNHSE